MLPGEVAFVSATPTETSGPNPLVWNLGDLPANQTRTITITVQVQSWVTQTFTNTAQVDSPTYDPDPGNNQDREPTTVLAAEANLSLVKSDDPDPVVPGTLLTYTLTVSNTGPSDALGVVVSDTLPGEVTFVNANPSQSGGPNPLLWNVGTLAAGENRTFTILVQVQPWVTQTFTNTALVTSRTFDPDLNNNEDEEPTSLLPPEADLSVSKSDDPDPVIVGDLLTYTLTVFNAGPSDAQNVVVSDTLPVEASFVNADPAQDRGPNPLGWDIGTLPAGESRAFTITVQVELWVTQTFTNTAVVTSTTFDPDTTNNETEEPTQPIRRIDLSVIKADDPAAVVPGTFLTYTLTISNAGPSDAENVVVLDILPGEVSFISATPPQDSGPNPLVWNIGDLPVNQTRTITINVQVHSWVTQTFTNTAQVDSSTGYDPDPSNNEDQEPTIVLEPEADLLLLKTDNPDPVMPGTLLTYTLTVSNAGPSDARNVVVSDTLPGEVTFVSAAPPQTSGPNPLLWNLGTVPAGEDRIIEIVVQVQSWVTQTFTNTAVVTSTTFDPDPSNNDREEPTSLLEPEADLSIAKADDPDGVVPGAILTYTLTIYNAGPSDAQNVLVSDTLPTEVSLLGATPPQDSGPNPLVWNVGTLTAGESRVFTVTVQVPRWVTQPFTNTAIISSTTYDPDSDNNETEEPTTPLLPSLAISKDVQPSEAVGNMPITFIIRITNTSQVTFDPLMLSDTLPANFHYVAGSGVPADPDIISEPLLVWQSLGPLPPNDIRTVTFAVTVTSGITGTYVNEALVGGVSPAGTFTDTDEAWVQIMEPAVAIDKLLVAADEDLVAPNYVTFTITITNMGITDIAQLPLQDQYDPYYLSFVWASPMPDEPDDDGLLTWYDLTALGPNGFGQNLAPGEAFQVTTVFLVAHEIVTFTINTAIITDAIDTYDNIADRVEDSEPVSGIPTALDLLYFRAQAAENSILLEWETAWERDNWGFALYRSTTPNIEDAEWLHFELGQGSGQFQGQRYQYEDKSIDPGQVYYYWLEDLDLNNRVMGIWTDGPVTALMARYRLYLPIVHR
jgi:uncharacterized repeat protein (TIGR01451 family)